MSPESATNIILLIVTICYLALCAVSPFGRCRTCRGFGFRTTTTFTGRMKRGRDCRRCDGYGYRIRTGRRLINLVNSIRRDGQR